LGESGYQGDLGKEDHPRGVSGWIYQRGECGGKRWNLVVIQKPVYKANNGGTFATEKERYVGDPEF